MKKSNILIAMVAVMISAASAAKAEVVSVNFDGRTSEAGSFSEAIAAIPVPGTDEDPILWIEPWLPGSITPPMTCTGSYPDGLGGPYNVENWYEMVHCSNPAVYWDQIIAGAQGQTKSAEPARMLHPGLQQKLRDILTGYCNTYPEFAEVVLPMLKEGETKIVTRDGFVYILSGNSIIRFGGKAVTESENEVSSRKKPTTGLALVDAAVEAGAAVYTAVQAWNDYSSYPPVPDSGTANDYHGPALTVKPGDGDPFNTHGYGKEE